MLDRLRQHRIDIIKRLHEVNGEPHPAIATKHTAFLTPLLEWFILAALFFMVATATSSATRTSA